MRRTLESFSKVFLVIFTNVSKIKTVNKYKTTTVVDPMTFNPIIGIFYNEKPFVSINIAMSKEDAKTLPFYNKENFEDDWKELTEFLKEDLRNRLQKIE